MYHTFKIVTKDHGVGVVEYITPGDQQEVMIEVMHEGSFVKWVIRKGMDLHRDEVWTIAHAGFQVILSGPGEAKSSEIPITDRVDLLMEDAE